MSHDIILTLLVENIFYIIFGSWDNVCLFFILLVQSPIHKLKIQGCITALVANNIIIGLVIHTSVIYFDKKHLEG